MLCICGMGHMPAASVRYHNSPVERFNDRTTELVTTLVHSMFSWGCITYLSLFCNETIWVKLNCPILPNSCREERCFNGKQIHQIDIRLVNRGDRSDIDCPDTESVGKLTRWVGFSKFRI